MSTILKALKKLEQEKEGRRADIQRPGTDLITRQVFSRTVRFAWLRRTGLFWFLILSVVLVGGGGLYMIGRAKGTAIEKNIPNQQTPPIDTSQAGHSAGRAEAHLPAESAKIPGDSPLADQRHPNRTGPPQKAYDRDPGTGNITDEGPPDLPEPSPSADDTKTSPQGGDHASRPEILPPATSRFGAKPMTDGRLSVQAIAWSPVAGECMAVVNDRIVHPGDAVDGFIVLAVEPDQIVVRSNQQTWFVPFGQGKSGN